MSRGNLGRWGGGVRGRRDPSRTRCSKFAGGFTNPLTDMSWYAAFWASDPSWTPPADGAAVDSWRNGGTLGTAAVQATGAKQPLYRAAAANLNSKPAIDFDGTDDGLEVLSGVSLAQSFTVVWIGSLDTTAGTRAHVALNSAATTRSMSVQTAAWRLNAGSSITGGTPSISTPYMVRNYVNGASSEIVQNGTSLVTGNAGALALDVIVLGSAFFTPTTYSFFQDGQTAFVGIYPGDVTADTQWSAFKAWVTAFYGIAIA